VLYVVQLKDLGAPWARSLARVLPAHNLVLREGAVLAVNVAAVLAVGVWGDGVAALEEGCTGVEMGFEHGSDGIPLVAVVAERLFCVTILETSGQNSVLNNGLGELEGSTVWIGMW
jgi:hypothetical protein